MRVNARVANNIHTVGWPRSIAGSTGSWLVPRKALGVRGYNASSETKRCVPLKSPGDAWAVYRGETTHDIEIWFTPEAARLVTETTWHPTQKVKSHKDGSATLSFRVAGLEEITGWVLAWAGQCKVIQPPELRQRVIERFQQAIEMHREGSDV